MPRPAGSSSSNSNSNRNSGEEEEDAEDAHEQQPTARRPPRRSGRSMREPDRLGWNVDESSGSNDNNEEEASGDASLHLENIPINIDQRPYVLPSGPRTGNKISKFFRENRTWIDVGIKEQALSSGYHLKDMTERLLYFSQHFDFGRFLTKRMLKKLVTANLLHRSEDSRITRGDILRVIPNALLLAQLIPLPQSGKHPLVRYILHCGDQRQTELYRVQVITISGVIQIQRVAKNHRKVLLANGVDVYDQLHYFFVKGTKTSDRPTRAISVGMFTLLVSQNLTAVPTYTNSDQLECKKTCDHKNGDTSDNRLANLRWATGTEQNMNTRERRELAQQQDLAEDEELNQVSDSRRIRQSRRNRNDRPDRHSRTYIVRTRSERASRTRRASRSRQAAENEMIDALFHLRGGGVGGGDEEDSEEDSEEDIEVQERPRTRRRIDHEGPDFPPLPLPAGLPHLPALPPLPGMPQPGKYRRRLANGSCEYLVEQEKQNRAPATGKYRRRLEDGSYEFLTSLPTKKC